MSDELKRSVKRSRVTYYGVLMAFAIALAFFAFRSCRQDIVVVDKHDVWPAGPFHIQDLIVDNSITQRGSIYSTVVVDLAQSPYSVVPNSTGAAVANMTGIKLAIATWTGLHARLVLPPGVIYVGQDGVNKWSIQFPTTSTDLELTGYGMFGSILAQYGPGTGGEWDLFNVQGTRIELDEFGMYQDTITTPDPGQQNHMMAVYDGAVDIYGHNLYFGKSIGDQLRWFSNAGTIKNIHFTELLFKGAGTVTSAPPNGRTGSRSGIAVQRGCDKCELDHFYMDGQENSQIDEEPSGGASTFIHIHDGITNNLLSNTSVSDSFGGESGGAIDTHQRVENLLVLGGRVTIGQTTDLQIDGLSIFSSAAYPADPTEASLVIRQINSDIQLRHIKIERTGTSGNGIAFDMENLGGSRSTIDGLDVYQTTSAVPVMLDAVANMKLTNVKVRYEGASPGSFDAIEWFAVDGSCDNPQVDNVQVTSTGTMRSALYIAVRTPRTMNNIEIHHVQSTNVTTCVQTSLGAGGTLDPTPIYEGIACGTNAVWFAGNAGDNPVTTLFPIVGGNFGTVAAPIYEGTAPTPETFLSAIQGSTYTYLGDASTATFWKATGTGNTGWIQSTGSGAIYIGDINHQALVNGPTLQSLTIPSTSYTFGEVNRIEIGGVVPIFPNDLFALVIRVSAAADTTAHTSHSGAIAAESTSTRSAGANDLTNTAIECTASGGQVNECFHALAGDVTLDGGSNLTVNSGFIFMTDSTKFIASLGTIFPESSGTNAIDISGTPTNAIKTRAATNLFDVENAAASSLTFYNANFGIFRMVLGADATPSGGIILSPNTPTSVDHGSLETGSTDWWGTVTGIGANSAVVLTFSSTFPARSRCTATTNSVAVTVETIVVTARSATTATFSCYSVAAVPALSNCDDFTYECVGQ